jgi:hypothetical protein
VAVGGGFTSTVMDVLRVGVQAGAVPMLLAVTMTVVVLRETMGPPPVVVATLERRASLLERVDATCSEDVIVDSASVMLLTSVDCCIPAEVLVVTVRVGSSTATVVLLAIETALSAMM